MYTNADTPADAAIARKNGAQGIGLVRTGALAERLPALPHPAALLWTPAHILPTYSCLPDLLSFL